MVPEEAALFRSENMSTAGTRSAFDRETGRHPLRKARGGCQKKLYITSVENDGVRHLPAKTVGGLSLSLGDYSQPVSCLTGASWSGPLWEAHSPGPVAFAVPEKFQEEAEGCRLVHLDWEGDTSAIRGVEHLVWVHIKWCCQHGPGGTRGLFFQIISSRLVRVKGHAN